MHHTRTSVDQCRAPRHMQPLRAFQVDSPQHGILVPALTAILPLRRVDAATTAAQARPVEWKRNTVPGPSAASAPTRPGIVIWGRRAAALAGAVSTTWTASF